MTAVAQKEEARNINVKIFNFLFKKKSNMAALRNFDVDECQVPPNTVVYNTISSSSSSKD
jgi:hypothetical protein